MRISKKNPLGTDVITQIGIVVKDIDKSAQAYAEIFGVKKPEAVITAPQSETHALYKGQPTEARAKLAFFQFKNISLELIDPIGGPSTWQEFLETKGEGVHHIAFNIKKSGEKLKCLAEKGINIDQQGDFRGGCYKYLNATEPLKVILEFLERKLI